MAFTLPSFNLVCDIWDEGHAPGTDAPDFVSVPCQNYVDTRRPAFVNVAMSIRIPAGAISGLSGTYYSAAPAYVESPQGSGHFWSCVTMCKVHEGFPNEYWMIMCFEVDPTTLAPFPPKAHLP